MAIDNEVLIARLRETFGDESQETIGKKIHLSQGSISKILSGFQKPPLEIVYDIAQIYGVSVDWLLGLSNKKRITHYSGEMTYASSVEALLGLKNHGANLEYNSSMQKVLLETDDELLCALINRALGLKRTSSEAFQYWMENNLSLFEDKGLLWSEVWKQDNLYPFTNISMTEKEWLNAYKEAEEEMKKILEMAEPDVNMFSGG